MRTRLQNDIKDALKSGDKIRLTTLRLIQAAIKDKDLSIGTSATGQTIEGDKISDHDILTLLQKMVKQRRESLDIYRKAGRNDLADQEAQEIKIIEQYLPQQMDDAEIQKTITSLLKELQIQDLKDMGRVMGVLKSRHSGLMDFAKASAILKQTLK